MNNVQVFSTEMFNIDQDINLQCSGFQHCTAIEFGIYEQCSGVQHCNIKYGAAY